MALSSLGFPPNSYVLFYEGASGQEAFALSLDESNTSFSFYVTEGECLYAQVWNMPNPTLSGAAPLSAPSNEVCYLTPTAPNNLMLTFVKN